MPLRNILKKGLISCKPGASIFEIADLMRVREVGAILVVEERRAIGIITDRDLVLRCLTELKDLSALTAEDVMSGAVETVSDDGRIYDVVQQMRKASICRVVVVNELGEATGLISLDDVFDFVADAIAAMKEVVRLPESKFVEKNF